MGEEGGESGVSFQQKRGGRERGRRAAGRGATQRGSPKAEPGTRRAEPRRAPEWGITSGTAMQEPAHVSVRP